MKIRLADKRDADQNPIDLAAVLSFAHPRVLSIVSMELPADLRLALTEAEYDTVSRWWDSLSADQQQEYSDVSQMTEREFAALADLDEVVPDAETQPYYDYLVNHEMRLVGYADDVAAKSSYKIMSSYVAALGSDYRHGDRGTVS